MAIDGIKMGPPVLGLRLLAHPDDLALCSRLCRLLTIARINIAFMTGTGLDETSASLCCIDPGHREKVARIVDQDVALRTAVRFEDSLGLLTLFPHNAAIGIMGAACNTLTAGGVRIIGLASSISALTFVVEEAALSTAVDLLAHRFGGYGREVTVR